MKQLHNIVAPLILFCLMAAVSLPVLAQEQEGEAVSQQTQDEITPKEEQDKRQQKGSGFFANGKTINQYQNQRKNHFYHLRCQIQQ